MYKRIFTIQRTVILIFAVIFLVILWYMYTSTSKNEEDALQEIISFDHTVYKCCTQLNATLSTNLYFLKTHKTGSSTVTNILMRFAYAHSLSMLWPKVSSYYEPLTVKSLWPSTVTPNNKYHLLAFHTRYTPKLKSFQYPDTKLVTILRHPAASFQSAYEYYMMSLTTKMTFEEFVKAPVKPAYLGGWNSAVEYKGYNSMSVDLGFNLKNTDNTSAVEEFVEKIDDEFDLVMITEYMDESLVLLANLMGWPLEYVAYLPINAKASSFKERYRQTEEDKLVLLELNKVDTELYHHFLNKFLRCIRQYGEREIQQQVLQLREMNRKFYERCIITELGLGPLGTKNYVLRNYTDLECVNATIMYPQ